MPEPHPETHSQAPSKRFRIRYVLGVLLLLPIVYVLSVPWVVQMIRPTYLYGGKPGWTDGAVSAYCQPSEYLFNASDTYKAFQRPYGRFVRRTIELFSG